MLMKPDEEMAAYEAFGLVRGYRYCQLVMEARRGLALRIEPDGVSCPAAAAAFGLRELPAQLASGKGLVGFGIVSAADTGRRMFAGMPRLPGRSISGIAASPLASAPRLPDVVVVEAQPEQLMWILLADLNLKGGQRRSSDTAVLQATCVDCTIIPFLEQRVNFSLGCYGCREATDLAPAETVIGFPGTLLEPLTGAVEQLGLKAIPRSRSKLACESFRGRVPPAGRPESLFGHSLQEKRNS